ncbi:MAG TPA: DUF302 domain-containing protein [Ignavibacteriaceae bacterium]|nr:DUF302 domain-containing protein [Ignavibacteriaceae bacterium]
MQYGFSKSIKIPFDEAITKVTDELKKEGFGVLTTIDVKDTLKKKLDVDFKRYTILGACNPTFAHKGLSIENDLGLLLPCNVVVSTDDNGTDTRVSVFDPMIMTKVIDNPGIKEVAEQVKSKLEKVFDNI